MLRDLFVRTIGKLAKSTILNGFAALKVRVLLCFVRMICDRSILQTLSEVLADPNCDAAKELGGFRHALETLTGRYYS